MEGGKLDRRWLPNTLRGIPKTIKALFIAFRLIRLINPDIVVSFGGYISVPVVIAAYICKKPIITHEQTPTISLATKINSYFATKIALSFNTFQHLPKSKVVITGNLLRSEIYLQTSTQFKSLESKLHQFPLIYVTGGNQGSTYINKSIIKILDKLTQSFTIIHQTGNLDYPKIKFQTSTINRYYPHEYIGIDNIGWILNHAKIIVSRSGINICQEIVALHKSSILIPLPSSQQNEQLLNAKWVLSKIPKNTRIISQNNLNPQTLQRAISSLSKINQPLSHPIPTPNHKLLNLIHETI